MKHLQVIAKSLDYKIVKYGNGYALYNEKTFLQTALCENLESVAFELAQMITKRIGQ